MRIVSVPDPILLEKARRVKKIDKGIVSLAHSMTKTLLMQKDPIGVGLSGNQVGELLRICVIRPDEHSEAVTVMINPEILESTEGSAKRKATLEGCLSIPEVWGYVLRPKKVRVGYADESGSMHNEWFDGFASIVVQHELDHLNGILFTQRVLEQGRQLYKEVEGSLEPWVI